MYAQEVVNWTFKQRHQERIVTLTP